MESCVQGQLREAYWAKGLAWIRCWAEAAAEAPGMSVHVVRHDLRYAQAWLRGRLAGFREE